MPERYKIIDFPVGQTNDPLSGKHYSLPFLQQLPSFGPGPLKGFFELTGRPSRAFNLDAYVALELQRYKDTFRCGALGAEVPGHRQEQLTQTFDMRLLKTHFLHRFLIEKSQQNRIELVTRPADYQLPELDFELNHHGEADVALFDFTSMFAASNSSYVKEKNGKQILLTLVGDGLLEVNQALSLSCFCATFWSSKLLNSAENSLSLNENLIFFKSP